MSALNPIALVAIGGAGSTRAAVRSALSAVCSAYSSSEACLLVMRPHRTRSVTCLIAWRIWFVLVNSGSEAGGAGRSGEKVSSAYSCGMRTARQIDNNKPVDQPLINLVFALLARKTSPLARYPQPAPLRKYL